MISELDYTGPPPEWEPICVAHGVPMVRGECPLCRDEAKAEDSIHEPHRPGAGTNGGDDNNATTKDTTS